MVRAVTQHPLLIGVPLGMVAGACVHLMLGAGDNPYALAIDIAVSVAAGLAVLIALVLVCGAINRRREAALHTKRYTHILARVNASEIEILQLKSRLEETASTYEVEAAQRNQRLVNEMKMIENLVQQMAVGQKAREEVIAAEAAKSPAKPGRKRAAADIEEPTSRLVAEMSETELLEVIQSALEDNRIDLYLQPIVSLPQRKVARYEGLARLRSLDGEVIEPQQYETVAGAAGLMPVIDNLLLFRCVQIVRRLTAKSNRRSILCRISSHSLLDTDFFPQFLEFMTENKSLKDSLLFEFAHETLDLAGTEGETNLGSLAALGFSFALADVNDLKLDMAWLKRQHFRVIKAPITLLGVLGEDPSNDVAVDNFMTRLQRQGLELIVDGIADEASVLDIIERDVKWGEGRLFGGPRPIRRELLIDDSRISAA